MNIPLANIVLSKPFGFVTEADLPAIIAADRLCWLLVRCGCQLGRFSCPAQNLAEMLKAVEAVGDYVRDVSFPSYVIDEAKAYMVAMHSPPPQAGGLVHQSPGSSCPP